MAQTQDFSKQALDQLLEKAAIERDRHKFLELLRQINRIRAERWLRSGQAKPAASVSIMELESFDLFSGAQDRDASWLETVVGVEQAKARLYDISGATPGEYFIFHARTHSVVLHVDSRAGTQTDVDGPTSRIGAA